MKDPAALLYIDTWLTSTAGMDSDARGWYLNLILHQYDKKDLPNDVEELAVLAGVKFSEFDRFKQVFEQVLSKKFIPVYGGGLTNPIMDKIITERKTFLDERSRAGKVSYIMRYFAKKHNKEYKEEGLREFVKGKFDLTIDIKENLFVFCW